MAGQEVPLLISVAPFPEGFQGDMDETWQQGVLLMSAFIEGNFLTGLILPPGSTLPSSDQGPIAMGGVWYFWNPATGSYQPQVVPTKVARNFVKNSCYQVQQTGASFTIPAGVTPVYDMSICRASGANVLAVSADVGPPSGGNNDLIPSAIKYTVGPSLVPTPAATDLYAHEHLFEGIDIAMLPGQALSLSFSAWTNTAGTYSFYLASSGRDASYVGNYTLAANAWTRVLIPGIPPLPISSGTWHFGEGQTGLYLGFAMLVGTQWRTSTLNSWQPLFAAGSAANTNLLTVVNNQLDITGIKLEAAPGPTYLSVPSFEADLEELGRYYFTTFLYQSLTQGTPINLFANQVGSWACAYVFPRRMAQIPVVTPYSYKTQAPGLATDISANPYYDVQVASLSANRRGIVGTGVSTVNTTGNLNATAVITGIPSTAGINIGAAVAGSGIPINTTVVSIPSPTSVGLSQVATQTATNVSLRFTNYSTFVTSGTTNSYSTTGNTDGLTTAITGIASTASIQVGMPVSSPATPISTTGTINGRSNILTAIPSTASILAGMTVAGANIPSSAVVVSVDSSSQVTISQQTTASSVVTGTVLIFGANPIPLGAVVNTIVSGTQITISLPTTVASTGVSLIFGTNSITAIPSTTQMAPGMPISGNGIPGGSTIASIVSATAITISNFLTAFGTAVPLTVGLFNKGDLFWTLICADARLT